MEPPRVVALGGGTGLPVVLRGLADVFHDPGIATPTTLDHLAAIVTVTDDGGSSGRLRRELGILPPGDIRNCLAALAEYPSPMAELLQHRFVGANGLKGHSVGNLLLAALTEMTGDFATAVERLGEILALRGRVFPSTRENVALRAEFHGGEIIDGETAIVARGQQIKRLSLEREVRPLPEALQALVNAEGIVVGPGSLYTSILPNLLINGIAATISGVNAVRIYVANLMTEPGETDGFTLNDHLRVIHEHVGLDLFDYIL
ncbi:MAG: gluconeogenesis factor YvcK family protein, partial [Acidimicrobiia bacterium]